MRRGAKLSLDGMTVEGRRNPPARGRRDGGGRTGDTEFDDMRLTASLALVLNTSDIRHVVTE